MKNCVVTISREFGSGGRTIGKKLAEQLGIPCYDSELIQKIAQESGFAEDYVKTSSEDAQTSVMGFALSPRIYGKTNEDYLWEIQTKIIRDLAKKAPCVIVGRCADYILHDTADCLTVFIHADPAFRAKRIVEVYGERDETPGHRIPAAQRIKEKDKRRAAYHRFYTDMKWGQAQNYQVALDSGILGMDQCVAVLARLYYCSGKW